MNEQVIGHFLRYKRTHADRKQFPVLNIKRRTPGLTRDEVAALANVSLDWYTRIEQGRPGVNASSEVLASLCHALSLSSTEENYLFNLAGYTTTTTQPANNQQQTLTTLIEKQMPNPAFIMDNHLTILAANEMFTQIYGTLDQQPSSLQNNQIWRTFHDRHLQEIMIDWSDFANHQVARFRQIYSKFPDSEELFKVFTSVKDNQQFQTPWQQLAVENLEERRLLLKISENTTLYLIEQTLIVPEQNLSVVIQIAGDEATKHHLLMLMH